MKKVKILNALKIHIEEIKEILNLSLNKIEEVNITSVIEENKEEIAIEVVRGDEDITIYKEDLEEMLEAVLNVKINKVIILPEDEEVIILARSLNGMRLI